MWKELNDKLNMLKSNEICENKKVMFFYIY